MWICVGTQGEKQRAPIARVPVSQTGWWEEKWAPSAEREAIPQRSRAPLPEIAGTSGRCCLRDLTGTTDRPRTSRLAPQRRRKEAGPRPASRAPTPPREPPAEVQRRALPGVVWPPPRVSGLPATARVVEPGATSPPWRASKVGLGRGAGAAGLGRGGVGMTQLGSSGSGAPPLDQNPASRPPTRSARVCTQRH